MHSQTFWNSDFLIWGFSFLWCLKQNHLACESLCLRFKRAVEQGACLDPNIWELCVGFLSQFWSVNVAKCPNSANGRGTMACHVTEVVQPKSQKKTRGCLVSLLLPNCRLSCLPRPPCHRYTLTMCPLRGWLHVGFAVSASALPVLKQRIELLLFMLLMYSYRGLHFIKEKKLLEGETTSGACLPM